MGKKHLSYVFPSLKIYNHISIFTHKHMQTFLSQQCVGCLPRELSIVALAHTSLLLAYYQNISTSNQKVIGSTPVGKIGFFLPSHPCQKLIEQFSQEFLFSSTQIVHPLYRAFTHDDRAAILVFQINETAAILVFQTNPKGVKPFLT